ncbi:MAG: metallopeptidase [Desulfurococcales archaeon]|nr:metallopeptidase [Desulfurococcales archaeon]
MPRKLRYEVAPDICKIIGALTRLEVFKYIDSNRVYCVRSYGSRSKAVARIYGMARPWVVVLGFKGYVIEVISERFDKLDKRGKLEVIIHELLHIPYTFSGALRPHGPKVNSREVKRILRIVEESGVLEELPL